MNNPDVNKILFGHDDTKNVVAVETTEDTALMYIRENDNVRVEERKFEPWILLSQKIDLESAEYEELDGDGYNYLAKFPTKTAYNAARLYLREHQIDFLSPQQWTRQFLIQSGITLFKDMSFSDIHRLQLDIETKGISPKYIDNEIIMIALSDNKGYSNTVCGNEKEILQETCRIINELDPDVIEGHNIFNFDLKYIQVRAQMNNVKMLIGRDKSEMTSGSNQQCAVGYYSLPFTPSYIYGRHIIDTLLSTHRYDLSKGELSSYGLKAVSKQLGISEPDRVIIPYEDMIKQWETNPEYVKKYALQDVYETKSLAEIVCPPEFFLNQMVPDSYQRSAISGNGEKINSIFIRYYLHKNKAIPKQNEQKELPGGYTELKKIGVVKPIVKCDVESLYPSIILTKNISPKTDSLGIFIPALKELTNRRLSAKKKLKTCDPKEKPYWDGLQSAFKILINSFYGYLAGPFNFNDYEAARMVTKTGQTLIKEVVKELENTGSIVVEIDTDGVYFKPPEHIDSEEKEIEYVNQIGNILPEGINLAHDGRYQAMLSLKRKNYALKTYSDEVIFKGSSLRSRADEKFGRDFIKEAVTHLLDNNPQEAHKSYIKFSNAIRNGKLNVTDFSRRERITNKTFTSSSRKRLAKAAENMNVGEYLNVYQRSDGSLASIKDYKKDEDKYYLLDKLYKFALRLKDGFGDDFDKLFPKPDKSILSEKNGQKTLDLFE
ncbi:MAG: DNA polymerase domain-containing protein [Armatimonadota bacterium]